MRDTRGTKIGSELVAVRVRASRRPEVTCRYIEGQVRSVAQPCGALSLLHDFDTKRVAFFSSVAGIQCVIARRPRPK